MLPSSPLILSHNPSRYPYLKVLHCLPSPSVQEAASLILSRLCNKLVFFFFLWYKPFLEIILIWHLCWFIGDYCRWEIQIWRYKTGEKMLRTLGRRLPTISGPTRNASTSSSLALVSSDVVKDDIINPSANLP